jgi:hypothetical protein
MVMTEVTIKGETLEMWLPVMDGANKAMMKSSYTYKGNAWVNGKKVEVEKTVDPATMFDVNKTLMRCLTKNLAMFGLGFYIYAGEDLPEEEVSAPKEHRHIKLNIGDDNYSKVLNYVAANKDKPFSEVVKMLETKYEVVSDVKNEIKKHHGSN